MSDRGNRVLRWLDYFVGIPLTVIAGIIKTRQRVLPPTEEIRRIGILATAAIGDTILLSAALQDLKEFYPLAEMTFFAGSSNTQIAEMTCPQDTLISLPVSRPDKAISLIRNQGKFDLWIDTGPWPRINAILTAFSINRFSIGYRTKGQARHFVYDAPVLHRSDQHEMQNMRALMKAAGCESKRNPKILPSWIEERQEDYLVMHMVPGGYMSEYKEWSLENWVKLINTVTSRGIKVVLTGAPPDREKTHAVFLSCKNKSYIEDKAGTVPLTELPALLARAGLVISVNTGIMHMAAAVGAPLIALHGPTSVNRWGPILDEAVNFVATSPSAGCLNLGFEYDKNDPNSLDTISPDSVAAKALEMLKI